MVFDRFGMNRDAVDLREVLFHTILQSGGTVVDLGDR
jgi:hypothetical protein